MASQTEIMVDTKGLCLLCLKPGLTLKPRSLASHHGLKQLLNYLRVDVKQLFNCLPAFTQVMNLKESMGVKATLCSECSFVTQEFNKWYQEYEKVLIHFDNCVQSIHQSINDGDQSPERVQEYVDRMRCLKAEDVFNSSFAYNLRSEALKKCASKLKARAPYVKLKVLNLDIVKSNQRNGNGLFNSGVCTTNHPPDLSPCNDRGNDGDMVNSSHLEPALNIRSNRTIPKNKGLSCNTCSKTFLSNRSLVKHMRIHRNNPSSKRCSICKFEAKSFLELKHHRTDKHLIHIIKGSLGCVVSDVKCGQVIDSIFDKMVNSNRSCFKCQLKFIKKTTNLKRHAVNAHFQDFVQLVENRVNDGIDKDDGRNQPLLEYLGLTRSPANKIENSNTNEDTVNVRATPSRDNATPGCSKNVISSPSEHAAGNSKKTDAPIEEAPETYPRLLRLRLGADTSTPRRFSSRHHRPLSSASPERGQATPEIRKEVMALTNGKQSVPADRVTCPKCCQKFDAGRRFDKHLPVCCGLSKSESPRLIRKNLSPSPHPSVMKLYDFAEDKANYYQCPFCSFRAVHRSFVSHHLEVQHVAALLHQTQDSSVTLENCSMEVTLLLREMGMGGETNSEKKCFKCEFSSESDSTFKRHLVKTHFEELRQMLENRLVQKMELSETD